METATMEMEQKQVIETEIAPRLQEAREFLIKTPEDRAFAASRLKEVDSILERLDSKFQFTELKEKSLRAYQAAQGIFKAFTEPGQAVKDAWKLNIKGFDTRLAIQAQKEAELAEAKRRDQEAKAQEALLEKAAKEDAKGNHEKAATLLEQAEAPVVAPSFAPPPPAVKKLVTKAEVTNMTQLCRLIAEGVIPFSVVEVNQSQLNAWAKTQDVKREYAGIRLFQESAGRV